MKNKVNNVSDAIFSGVKTMMNRRSTPWVGTVSELGETLQNRMTFSAWPGSPSAFRVQLNKVVNRLRNAGIRVVFSRANDRKRTRLVEFIG